MIDIILNQLEGVKKSKNGYMARCPAHADRSPSLSIKELEDGQILLHCFSGCSVNKVCEALGITINYLFPDHQKTNPKQKKQLTEYQRRRNLERKYEIMERWAFVAMADFKHSTEKLFTEYGLDIPDQYVPVVHKLPLVNYYLSTLSTGSSEEKLELLREGVIAQWAKCYSPKMTSQLSKIPS